MSLDVLGIGMPFICNNRNISTVVSLGIMRETVSVWLAYVLTTKYMMKLPTLCLTISYSTKTLWFMKSWALTTPLILIISLKATVYQFPCTTSQEASLVDANWILFTWQIAENLPSAFDIITIFDWKFEMVSTSQNIQTPFVKMSVCLICFLRHLIVRSSGHLHRLSADCKRYKGFKNPSQNGTNI